MDTLIRMRAFISVVEAEGYSAAARKIGRSKALLSKYVRELEDELGARLLNRTTRQFSLTESGQIYYQRALEIIRDIDNLSEEITENSSDTKGRIKISAPRTFGDATIGQSFMDFCLKYPDITLDIHLDDRFVDLVEEGFDLAIRITKLQDSSLIAKRLAPFHSILCGTPELIERVGEPQNPADMANLPCIVDTNSRTRNNWHFRHHDETIISVSVHGPMEVNSPIATKRAGMMGLGFCPLPCFIAEDEIKSGKLVQVLPEYSMYDGGIYIVYPHRRHLPTRVRTFIDHCADWFKENRVESQ